MCKMVQGMHTETDQAVREQPITGLVQIICQYSGLRLLPPAQTNYFCLSHPISGTCKL